MILTQQDRGRKVMLKFINSFGYTNQIAGKIMEVNCDHIEFNHFGTYARRWIYFEKIRGVEDLPEPIIPIE